MKEFWAILALVGLLSVAARAETLPPINGFKLKYGTSSGLLNLTTGVPSAFTCGVNGNVPTWNGTGFSCSTPAGGVTSVGLALPLSVFSISGSPVTGSGTLTGTFNTQAANQFFAGPVNGVPGTPAFRAMVSADLPGTIAANTTGTAANVTGVVAPANGGTGQATLGAAFTALYETVATTLGDLIYGGASGAPTRLAGDVSNTRKFLRELSVAGVAAAPVWDTLVSGDIPSLSSLYCALTGCTMTGTITTPAENTTTPSINFGTSNTGIYGPSSSTIGLVASGNEIARVTTTGFQVGTTATVSGTQTAIYSKAASASTCNYVAESSGGTKWFSCAQGSIYSFMDGGTQVISWSDATGFTSFGPNAAHYTFDATGSNTTTITTLATKDGSVTFPTFAISNRNTTVNNWEALVFEAQGNDVVAGIYGQNVAHTAGAQTGILNLATANAGTQSIKTRIDNKGHIEFHGDSAFTVTCNSNAGTSIVGNDVMGRFTAPGTPGTSCTVTFAAAWTNAPSCSAMDETTPAVLPMVSGTSTATITDSGLASGHVLSFHCEGYF